MSFKLPELPYSYDALEPHIDAKTMQIHHSKHHNGYTNNLNNAIDGTEMEGKTIEEICSTRGLSGAARNNGGGYFNHCLFWEIMSPDGGGEPSGEIASAINRDFENRRYHHIQGSLWIMIKFYPFPIMILYLTRLFYRTLYFSLLYKRKDYLMAYFNALKKIKTIYKNRTNL